MSLVQWFVLQPSTPTKQTVTFEPPGPFKSKQ